MMVTQRHGPGVGLQGEHRFAGCNHNWGHSNILCLTREYDGWMDRRSVYEHFIYEHSYLGYAHNSQP